MSPHSLLPLPPRATLTSFNDRGEGLTEVHILYPQKYQLQNLSTQKITMFFSIPQKIPLVSTFFATHRIPLFFARPPKMPTSFVDRKKSLLAKMSDPKKPLGTWAFPTSPPVLHTTLPPHSSYVYSVRSFPLLNQLTCCPLHGLNP